MLFDLALLFAAIVYGSIAVDLLLAPGWRRRFPGIAVSALAIVAWSAGELLVRHAADDAEVWLARRILFLGVCTLGPAFLWGASQATRASWSRERLWLFALFAAPGVVGYLSLWAGSEWFVHPTARPPRHGPFFFFHAAASWTMVFAGFAIFARFLAQHAESQRVVWLLALGAGIPFGVNVVFNLWGVPAVDPTPAVLGAVAVVFRFLFLETGLAPYYQPFARREVIEQIDAGLLVADAGNRVVDANAAAAEITGIDDPIGQLLHEVVARARSHPLRNIEVSVAPLSRGGIRFGTAALLEDRTELRSAERRVELATRFEALGFLISGVTHEINNPLSYVRGNLGMLRTLAVAIGEETELVARLPARARRVAREAMAITDEAIEGADRITGLVRRLGTFARDEDRAPARELDLAMVVRRAIEMAAMGRSPDLLRIGREDELPPVFAREEDVVQIILHLLINAIQAAGKAPPIEIELRALADHAEVRVIDRGPGIPPDLLPHVFDPFFSTKDDDGHLGLGLSLSFDLARQNRGELEAENRLGGGAAFILRLPVLAAPAEDR